MLWGTSPVMVKWMLDHAERLAKEHGASVYMTLEAVAAVRGVGVDLPEGFVLDRTTIGPLVRVAHEPFGRAYYLTMLLVAPRDWADVDPREFDP